VKSFSSKRYKLGSMQLSIEAIIILVIAIVLLGLGIGFIKQFFGKGSESLLGKFEPLKEDCDVNANSPLIPKEITLKQGESIQTKICVYNNQEKKVKNAVFKFLKCVGPDGVPILSDEGANKYAPNLKDDVLVINALGQDIERNRFSGYKVSITAGPSGTTTDSSQLGTYICNIVVTDEACINPTQTGSTAPCVVSGTVGPIQMTFNVE